MTTWLPFGEMVIERLAEPDTLDESVTIIKALLVPGALGVPLITPVLAAMDKPAGNPFADQEYEPDPPVAETCVLYAVPAWPAGNDVVVIKGPDVIVIENDPIAT